MNSRDGRTSTSKWQRHLPADSGQGHDTVLTVNPIGVLRRRPISSESAVSLSRCGVSNVRVVRIVEHWIWSSGNKRDGHKSRIGSTELEDHEGDASGALKTSGAFNMFSTPRRDKPPAPPMAQEPDDNKEPNCINIPLLF
jgi:hypothetical protein